MQLPAVCQSCRTIFRSGMALGDQAQAFMTGCTAGPCPNCGGTGQVPDGSYTIIDEILQHSPRYASREDLLAAARLLQEAVRASPVPDLDVLAEDLRREAPSAAPLVLRMFRDPAAGPVIGLIGILVAVLLHLASSRPTAPPVMEPPSHRLEPQHHQKHGSRDANKVGDDTDREGLDNTDAADRQDREDE